MATTDLDRPATADQFVPFRVVVGLVAVMWASEVADVVLDGRLDGFGIRPRRLDGLDGVVLSPFLHGGFGHLIGNTVPFLLLGCLIALSGTVRFVQVVAIVGVVGGLGTWLTGPENTIHIGASGLVFGFFTYLIARGVIARRLVYLAGGALVFMLYGGILWGLLPAPGISWQGHLFGAVGGVVAASALHGERATSRRPPELSPNG